MANEILTDKQLGEISGGEGKTTGQFVSYPKHGRWATAIFKNLKCDSSEIESNPKEDIEIWAIALESWMSIGCCSKLAEAAVKIGETLPIGAEFTLIKIGDEWELYKRAN